VRFFLAQMTPLDGGRPLHRAEDRAGDDPRIRRQGVDGLIEALRARVEKFSARAS